MTYCWYTRKNKILSGLEILWLSFVILFCIGVVISKITAGLQEILSITVFCGPVMYLAGMQLMTCYIDRRKFILHANGITVAYPFGYAHTYAWSEFSQIAICKVRINPKVKSSYSIAFRYVVGYEEKGPQTAASAYEKWSTQLYETRHWRTVITIEYSEDRYKNLIAKCPFSISDCRYLDIL